MQNILKVLKINAGEKPVVTEVSDSVESLQAEVGGTIQVVYPFNDAVGIVCNDEAKLIGMPLNRALYDDETGEAYDVIAGPMLVVGLTEDSFASLTDAQIDKYTQIYMYPEAFSLDKDGKIVVDKIDGKLSFDGFRDLLTDTIRAYFVEKDINLIVEPKHVEKGVKSYDGIYVAQSGSPVGMTIDIGSAYDAYSDGRAYESVADTVVKKVRNGLEHRPSVELDQLMNYKWVKQHMSLDLLGCEDVERLDKLPHTEVADGLNAVCRMHLGDSETESMTILVTHDMVKAYGISSEELFGDAKASSELRYPISVRGLGQVISEMMGGPMMEDSLPLYVVTTHGRAEYGAGAIAYDSFAEAVREQAGIEGDFYILPSSIHEVLVIPIDAEGPNLDGLKEMVSCINESEVAPEDRLSDDVYVFDSENRMILSSAEFEKSHKKDMLEHTAVSDRKPDSEKPNPVHTPETDAPSHKRRGR